MTRTIQLALLSCCASGLLGGPPEYRVVILNPIRPDAETLGTRFGSLEETGVVLGNTVYADREDEALWEESFIWRDGEYITVAPPAKLRSMFLVDINDHEDLLVSGVPVGSNCSHAALRVEGEWSILEPVEGWDCSSPVQLDPDGRVVGRSWLFDAAWSLSTVWEPGGNARVPFEPVVQGYAMGGSFGPDGTVHGTFIIDRVEQHIGWSWDGEHVEGIEPPLGYVRVTAPRFTGQGVAFSLATRLDGTRSVMIGLDHKDPIDLPDDFDLHDMNSSLEVLGRTGEHPLARRPALLRQGEPVLLSEVSDMRKIDHLVSAQSINDSGWITVQVSIDSQPRAEYPGALLIPACDADFDLDGDADFEDVSGFLDSVALNGDWADRTRDGSVNFDDVLAFLVAFGAGCP